MDKEFEQELLDLIDEKADIKHEHSEKEVFDLDRMKYRASWIRGFEYEVNDVVTYKKGLYICVVKHKGQLPTNKSYWDILAAISEKEVKVIGVGGSRTTSISGITDHSKLSNLSYASSGHIGFLPDTHLTDFDHSKIATALQAESDPIYTADKPNIVFDGDNISRLVNDAGYLTAESDPIFSASPSFGIDSVNISNWNEAYGWGDHSKAGYITDAPSDNKIYGRKNNSWVETGAGSNDHSLLSNLDFESSGHIGFQKELIYDVALKCYLISS